MVERITELLVDKTCAAMRVNVMVSQLALESTLFPIILAIVPVSESQRVLEKDVMPDSELPDWLETI